MDWSSGMMHSEYKTQLSINSNRKEVEMNTMRARPTSKAGPSARAHLFKLGKQTACAAHSQAAVKGNKKGFGKI